ncbi:Putative beta-lactamase-inhibitor-like, PepSY-like [Zobellia uliginosa]|uniref:Beta-lactamase-inhibitor-like, PepSY-like n=1 Tax=Zobellia uliginosa TaxID=143224 RepID=A0ABY1L0S3_9FLAO|nr:PepSY-like domain-containing protein [Zobellia uliginosa]SIS85727.1 Putative beta-lactamase-inhibitor-like, PepSY-like [Zobellia uliginosa]
MQKQILFLAALGTLSFSQAQDLPKSQVPSVILNRFNSQFPKATDVEWEMDGTLYNVEFEIGWNRDHDVWYDAEGKMVKQKEEIASKELPQAVHKTIETDFEGYSTDDVERITDEGKIFYKMELNSLLKQDWEVVFDANGNILSQIED